MSDGNGFGIQVAVEDLREKVEALAAHVERIEGLMEALVAELGVDTGEETTQEVGE